MVTSRNAPTISNTPGGRIGEGEYADSLAAHILALWNAAPLIISGVSGTDDVTGMVTPPISGAYTPGMSFWFVPANNNTDEMTIDLGAGQVDLVDKEGNPLEADALIAGSAYLLLVVAGPVFRVLNPEVAAASGGGGGSGADLQLFTSSGTWNKPATGSVAWVRVWGAGGSGGRGGSNDGAGGGGGGAFMETVIPLTSLGATVAVTVGAGGTAVTSDNVNGNAGGTSSFGASLSAFGGGGGSGSGTDPAGGGGGGVFSAGATSTGNAGADGGTPSGFLLTADATAINAVYGLGGSNAVRGSANVAGGGGGGGGLNGNQAGGDSVFGGGGGGGGVGNGASGGVGGSSIFGGGGGGGGNNTGAGGAGGTSKIGGNGGAGSSDSTNATAGAQPGGGGGGSESGNSGAGGAGMVMVITF